MVADLRHAQTFAGTLDQEGCKAHAMTLDVGSAGDVQKAVGEVEAAFGRLDALINNAGTDVTLPINLPLEPSAHPPSDEWLSPWDPLFLSYIVNAPRQLARLCGGV